MKNKEIDRTIPDWNVRNHCWIQRMWVAFLKLKIWLVHKLWTKTEKRQ